MFKSMRRLSVQLLLGVFAVVLLTTLSTGVPAYWLTQREVEEQAWRNVRNAQQATHALMQAEAVRLQDLATLLAERPTLQRLLREADTAELTPYLANFQAQSDLDLVWVCPLLCGAIPSQPYAMLDGQPTLLTQRTVTDALSGEVLGQVVVGRWLDAPFLRQLALSTGATQSLVTLDGRLLSSERGATALMPAPPPQEQTLVLSQQPVYATYIPLGNGVQPPTLWVETALSTAALQATSTRVVWLLSASTALVALAGAFGGLLYIRRLIAPLQQLTHVAERIRDGDLLATIPLFHQSHEVQTLSAALRQSQASMGRALEERLQARDWLNTLVQSIVEGVITLDEAGRITFFSQGAEALTGWTAAQALGQPLDQLLLPTEEGERFSDQLPPEGEKRLIPVRTAAGKNIVLAVTSAQLTAVPLQIALVLRDVTQDEARHRLHSYFLANTSHEFRTPLSTLNASMELLLDEQENLSVAEMRELLKPSHLSLVSLQTLVDNLLESSRIEAGHFTIRHKAVNFYQLLQEALHIVRPLLERRQQVVRLTSGTAVAELTADPTRLTQVLVNLLTNASKYSPQGTTIELFINQGDEMLRVGVADNGPGIPVGEEANLFRRFVRLATADTEQYGVGLGLYVVKTAIEAHGGRVGVENRPSGGAVFWFELPLATAEEQRRGGAEEKLTTNH